MLRFSDAFTDVKLMIALMLARWTSAQSETRFARVNFLKSQNSSVRVYRRAAYLVTHLLMYNGLSPQKENTMERSSVVRMEWIW